MVKETPKETRCSLPPGFHYRTTDSGKVYVEGKGVAYTLIAWKLIKIGVGDWKDAHDSIFA